MTIPRRPIPDFFSNDFKINDFGMIKEIVLHSMISNGVLHAKGKVLYF